MLTVPEHPFNLMAKVYREIFPLVHQELNMWREKSDSIKIPNCGSRRPQVSAISRFIVKEAAF